MTYQITVRYGRGAQRYHTFRVEAPGVREALTAAAAELPDDVAPEADLVELRVATDPDERSYVEKSEKNEDATLVDWATFQSLDK